MSDDNLEPLLKRIRSQYNSPPETPREEMWAVIQGRISEGGAEGAEVGQGRLGKVHAGQGVASEVTPGPMDRQVLSLNQARQARRAWTRRPSAWAMSAAAILVLGLGIGRMTAPGASPSAKGGSDTTSGSTLTVAPDSDLLRTVALNHLARTESLLTLARADANSGGLEARVGTWSRGLLAQTRLIMDARENTDPLLRDLLEDLELVLVQLVGAAAVEGDPAKVRSEWNLALEGLQDTEVLSRIRAVLPAGARFIGS